MAVPRLVLTLLGGFQARAEPGRIVQFPRRKGQALLAYLASPPGRSHPRDALAGLLWPDSPDEQARASLRHLLVVTRRALGSAARHSLVTDAETVTLDPRTVEVDAATFERLARENDVPELERAVELYHGDLLAGARLDEAPFEEWLRLERARLRELAIDILSRLLTRHRKARNTEAAIQTGLRLLALDATQEPMHRALIEMYASAGRRGAALHQYELCVEALRSELGVEPEPATRELHQKLLALPEADGRAAELPVKRPLELGGPRHGPPNPPPRPSSLRWEERYVTLLRATVDRPGAVASSALLDALATKARDFGGRVEEVEPAALVALFGGIESDEAPSRAARAAMAMLDGVGDARNAVELRVGLVVRPVMVAPSGRMSAWSWRTSGGRCRSSTRCSSRVRPAWS